MKRKLAKTFISTLLTISIFTTVLTSSFAPSVNAAISIKKSIIDNTLITINPTSANVYPRIVPSTITQSDIKNTKKISIRFTFFAVAKILSANGYLYTSELLNNSLNDTPKDLVYNADSSLSNYIKTTPWYKSEIKKFKDQLTNVKVSHYQTPGSKSGAFVKSNSSNDLYLAIHKFRYKFKANKINNKWIIDLRIFDEYNFEYWNYKASSGVSNRVVTAANNYGHISQNIGSSVPYNVYIYATDSK